MRKTYILHHNDPDGFGAAYAAYIKFGMTDSIKYIAVDYGRPMPELEDDSNVYVLDFSYPRNVLDGLVKRMHSVLVIDHHKSAMLDLEGHPNAIFDMNKSGAGLAWDYLAEAAKCHRQFWDDDLRAIAAGVQCKHDRAHRILINYAKDTIPEKWKELVEYLDTFLYEGNLICDIFDNANEEQKGAYFGEDYNV